MARMTASTSAYEDFARKGEIRRQFRRIRLRREDNIKMDLKEIEQERVEGMFCVGWGRVVGCCEHGNKW